MAPPISPPASSRAFRSAAAVAHPGRRSRRRQDAADRRGRRARHRACCCSWRRISCKHLPTTALAAVVIASAIGLFEFTDLRRIYRIQRWEFWLSIVCFAGVAVLGAIPGIGLAIVHRGHRVPVGWLAPAFGGARPRRWRQGLSRHHALSRRPPDSRAWCCSAGMRRCSSPMPNCSTSASWSGGGSRPPPVRWFVVAAEPVTSVDVTAADMLAELDEALHDGRHRVVLRRAQGSGQGQVEALRAVRAFRRTVVFSHHWRGRRPLPRNPSGGVGRLGRPGLT